MDVSPEDRREIERQFLRDLFAQADRHERALKLAGKPNDEAFALSIVKTLSELNELYLIPKDRK